MGEGRRHHYGPAPASCISGPPVQELPTSGIFLAQLSRHDCWPLTCPGGAVSTQAGDSPGFMRVCWLLCGSAPLCQWHLRPPPDQIWVGDGPKPGKLSAEGTWQYSTAGSDRGGQVLALAPPSRRNIQDWDTHRHRCHPHRSQEAQLDLLPLILEGAWPACSCLSPPPSLASLLPASPLPPAPLLKAAPTNEMLIYASPLPPVSWQMPGPARLPGAACMPSASLASKGASRPP